jgi:sec-independent protein translocase protein TatC
MGMASEQRATAEPPEDPFAHTRMTLGDHLAELKKRLFRGLLALVVTFAVCLAFNQSLRMVILAPYHRLVADLNAAYEEEYRAKAEAEPELRERWFAADGSFLLRLDERLTVQSPTEVVWFVLKIAGFAALALGGPFLLWQLWQFVAAGLYAKERRWVYWFFPPALVLFVSGVVFAFFLIVPYAMFYSLRMMDPVEVRADLRLEYYFDFVSTLSLTMGLVFQLPLLMMFVALVGIVEAATFSKLRGYFVVGAFALAALLTPGPDVFSQVMMAGPMIVLYEVGILGSRWMRRRSVESRA